MRKDPKFNDLLGGVWRTTMTDEVWQRVQAVRTHVGEPANTPEIKVNPTVGAQRERMREQLLKGGLRLAGLLNSIFK